MYRRFRGFNCRCARMNEHFSDNRLKSYSQSLRPKRKWMRVWVRIQVCQARYKNKEGRLSEQTCWIRKRENAMGVCICPLASFPLPISSSLFPSLLVAVLHAWERETESSFLYLADWGTPRFVGSFGHIICCVQSDFWFWLLMFVWNGTLSVF